MPQQTVTAIQNNFTKGLVTEFTGLNFPENAATDTENCVFTLVGDVTRRLGFNYEDNFQTNVLSKTVTSSINTYKWNNVGGDGSTQLLVQQTDKLLHFYSVSAATLLAPLSTQILVSTVDVSVFQANGATYDPSIECQFSDGNGYLFVYHPNCNPFYCTYVAGTVSANSINVQIRDFVGLPELGIPINSRPTSLTNEHLYNLTNQGWTQGNAYQALTATLTGYLPAVGVSHTFTVQAGLGATNGDAVQLTYTGFITDSAGDIYRSPNSVFATGTVTSYSGTSLTVNILTINTFSVLYSGGAWVITPVNHGYINTWFSDIGNYPSNSDQWWSFKDTTDVFNPTTTINNTALNIGYAPKGHFVLNAFQQQRTTVSSISSLTDVTTAARPTNGCWFQGRVWYTGINASQQAVGDTSYYTWTENIYFSQTVTDPSQFGYCYQTNDPTAEDLFDLLPTDGGVIVIQGIGNIYRLFPIANGLLVFGANGVYFITGSQGIGFTANDYTITKISEVQSISCTSFVNVQGLPYFWNEEGVYAVQPKQGGGLSVEPLTVGTILTFYNNIPLQSKKYVRGAYHPVDYIIQWTYRSTNETGITNRYHFDSILNFNTYNKAFYTYSFADTTPGNYICGINYVSGPGGSTSPDPVFKYLTYNSTGSTTRPFTFAEERDTSFKDFVSYDTVGVNYVSYFITGYSIKGKAISRFQPTYVTVYSRNDTDTYYGIQSIWDYATDPNSGRWSSIQRAVVRLPYFGMSFKRFKLRGQGLVMQIKILSTDGQPFEIMGWSMLDQVNQSA